MIKLNKAERLWRNNAIIIRNLDHKQDQRRSRMRITDWPSVTLRIFLDLRMRTGRCSVYLILTRYVTIENAYLVSEMVWLNPFFRNLSRVFGQYWRPLCDFSWQMNSKGEKESLTRCFVKYFAMRQCFCGGIKNITQSVDYRS